MRLPHDKSLLLRFPRVSSSSQNPRPCASCSVVTTRIEWTATPAGARGKGQRETQTPQQQNTEVCRVDLSERACGTHVEGSPCPWTPLRPQQGPLWCCQHPEQRLTVLLFDPGGCFVLPTGLVTNGTLVFLVPGWRPQTGKQCSPTGNLEPADACQSVCHFDCCPQTVAVRLSIQLPDDSRLQFQGGGHGSLAKSAQLAQKPASLVLNALLRPNPPRTRGRLAELLAASSHMSGAISKSHKTMPQSLIVHLRELLHLLGIDDSEEMVCPEHWRNASGSTKRLADLGPTGSSG